MGAMKRILGQSFGKGVVIILAVLALTGFLFAASFGVGAGFLMFGIGIGLVIIGAAGFYTMSLLASGGYVLGQVIAAKFRRFELKEVRLGYIPLLNREPKTKVNWAWRRATRVKAYKEDPTAADLQIFLLSGPLVTFILSAVCFSFLFAVSHGFSEELSDWNWLLAFFCMLNSTILVEPFLHPGASVYASLAQLKKDPQSMIDRCRLEYFWSKLNVRPRDYPDEALKQLGEIESGKYWAQLFRFYKRLDLGESEGAWVSLRETYEMVKGEKASEPKATIAYETATFAAVIAGDEPLAFEAFCVGSEAAPQSAHRQTATLAREYVWGDRAKAMEGIRELNSNWLKRSNGGPWLQDYTNEWFARVFPDTSAPEA